MSDQIALPIAEVSQVAEARRMATTRARMLGFSETDTGRVSIVVTEIGTNLLKHGRGGEIVLCTTADRSGLDVIGIDKGSGMHDIGESMRDGYSTSGSPGTGLGAIVRMSDRFDIYSYPDQGTVITAGFRLPSPPTTRAFGVPSSPAGAIEAEGICIPKQGEELCGDDWGMASHGNCDMILVADGLGHGPFASAASKEAMTIFRESFGSEPGEIIETIHKGLRSTRGAAAALATIDHRNRMIRYIGVGNIAGVIITQEKTHRMISHNGTLGHEVRKIQEFSYPWSPDSLLVMNSDGLATQWSIDGYPGLAQHQPATIAATIYRDFNRHRDDVTVVVARDVNVEKNR